MTKHVHAVCVLAAITTTALIACDSGDGSDSGAVLPALTREELLNPESCKDCHPRHYEQWSASMHAYAAADPVFIAMNKRGQEETGGQLGAFCVNCHAPMAVRENKITDFGNLDDVPAHLKGVTCFFCHNAVNVGPDHYNGTSIELANDDVMRAAIRNPVVPSTHKAAYSAYHDPTTAESSVMCGSCHDILTPKGVKLERTFQEYETSIFSKPERIDLFKSCQDCHMRRTTSSRQPIAEATGYPDKSVGARVFHQHLWAAVDVPLTPWPHADAMRSAVEWCELPSAITSYFKLEREPGVLGRLIVQVEADTGHALPSGAVQDRRVWIELIAYDEAGAELYSVGHIPDGQLEETADNPHPCMFREHLADDNGAVTHDFWEAASNEESRLMSFATGEVAMPHYIECDFRPPIAQASITPASIDIVIRVRPMGLDVLQDLVSTGHLDAQFVNQMPTFTIASRRATFNPETLSYGVSILDNDPKRGDCREMECLLDPTSAECTKPPL